MIIIDAFHWQPCTSQFLLFVCSYWTDYLGGNRKHWMCKLLLLYWKSISKWNNNWFNDFLIIRVTRSLHNGRKSVHNFYICISHETHTERQREGERANTTNNNENVTAIFRLDATDKKCTAERQRAWKEWKYKLNINFLIHVYIFNKSPLSLAEPVVRSHTKLNGNRKNAGEQHANENTKQVRREKRTKWSSK